MAVFRQGPSNIRTPTTTNQPRHKRRDPKRKSESATDVRATEKRRGPPLTLGFPSFCWLCVFCLMSSLSYGTREILLSSMSQWSIIYQYWVLRENKKRSKCIQDVDAKSLDIVGTLYTRESTKSSLCQTSTQPTIWKRTSRLGKRLVLFVLCEGGSSSFTSIQKGNSWAGFFESWNVVVFFCFNVV